MFEERQPDWLRRFTQEDMVALGMRTALATLGPFGAFFGDFLTQFVPNQRLDRLQDFVEKMHERLSSFEAPFSSRVASSEAYASLVEEVTVQAVRTPSDDRRLALVELLRTGLSRSDAELIDHQALLRILENINDPQILILMKHGSFSQAMHDTARAAFIAQHASTLDVRPPALGDDDDDQQRRWAIHVYYVDDLIARGLLRDVEGMVKSGSQKNVRITHLGKLLLQAIGQPVDRNA